MPDPREQLRQELQQPSGDAREQLRAMLAEENETSALGTFLTRLLKGTGDALLATPSATGDLLAMGAAAPALVPGGKSPGEAFREQQQKFPASVIRKIPRPTVDEIIAGGRAALAAVPGGVSPSEQFQFSMEDARSARERQETEHPIASTAGDVGGSIAALLLTKSPLQSTVRRAEQRLMQRPDIFFGKALTAERTAGVPRAVERAVNSNLARLGARGGFRAAETGLEAAYLEAVNEANNDPLFAATLAAGGQVGGSLALQTLKGTTKVIPGRPILSIGVTALSAAGLWQIIKSATPGGRDRILESLESGFDKATYGLMLGALGGIAGRGRGGQLFEDFLPVSEMALTIPRAAVLSVLAEMVDAPEGEQAEIESSLDQLMDDPEFEGNTDLERRIVQRLRSAVEQSSE